MVIFLVNDKRQRVTKTKLLCVSYEVLSGDSSSTHTFFSFRKHRRDVSHSIASRRRPWYGFGWKRWIVRSVQGVGYTAAAARVLRRRLKSALSCVSSRELEFRRRTLSQRTLCWSPNGRDQEYTVDGRIKDIYVINMNHKRSLHLLPELCDSLRWIATFADKSSFIYFVCCVRAQDYSSGRLLIAMTHDTRRFLARAVHTAVTTCPPFLLAVMIACRLLLGFEPLQYETNVTATAAVSLSLSKRFMGVLGVLHFFFEY